MQCNFVKKNDIPCKNKTIGDSSFCHLKTHHKSIDNYEEIYEDLISKIENNFTVSGIDKTFFTTEEIVYDGACMFRALARFIMKDLSMINRCKDDQIITDFKNIFLNNENKFDIETEIACIIQEITRVWLLSHKNQDFIDGISVADMVIDCHELDNMEEYSELYKHFAGDEDHIYEDTDKVYKSGARIGKLRQKKVKIQERWGGSPEQFAFASIFNTPIVIYTPQKYSRRSGKPVRANIKDSGSVYKHWQTLSKNGFCDIKTLSDNSYIELVLIEKGASHYQPLYKRIVD